MTRLDHIFLKAEDLYCGFIYLIQLICFLGKTQAIAGLQCLCVCAVIILFASSQQANGPRAADGRDSPVQETES